MSAPVLVPAWPEVLRVGLILAVPGPIGACAAGEWLHTPLQMKGGGDRLHFMAFGFWQNESAARCRLDLRDGAVRDRAVRCLWARLRPGEPEPLTAPDWTRHWYRHDRIGDSLDFWTLGTAVAFSAACPPWGNELHWWQVVDLGDTEIVPLDSPDRDLLALAAVLTHVFGGA